MSDRRGAIVRAAFRQVAEVGFEGLRLKQIAADAGIDHSTLYHHFPAKKDIVAVVAEHAIGRFRADPPAGAGPAETLRGHLAHLHRLLLDAPEVFVVTAELDLHARRDPAVRAVMARHEANWRRWLRDLLDAGAARGEWAPGVDPRQAVELVIAVVKGVQLAPAAAGAAFSQLDEVLTRNAGGN